MSSVRAIIAESAKNSGPGAVSRSSRKFGESLNAFALRCPEATQRLEVHPPTSPVTYGANSPAHNSMRSVSATASEAWNAPVQVWPVVIVRVDRSGSVRLEHRLRDKERTPRIVQGQMSRSQPCEKLEFPIGLDPPLQLFTEGYDVFKRPRPRTPPQDPTVAPRPQLPPTFLSAA